MGRVNYSSSSEPQKQTKTTYHFSHPHPLNLINYHPQTRTSTSCSGCNHNPSGMIYTCTSCNFFLHQKCFEMPNLITHPFHKSHLLTLLPKPDYHDGIFRGDGCGDTGCGFSYTCKPCGIDLHVLCAAMPLSVAHGSHPHNLDLIFEPPYVTKEFSCHICRGNGSGQWLYRCNICGFDAHLNCARGIVQVQQNLHPTNTNYIGFQAQTTTSRSVPLTMLQTQTSFRPMMQQNIMPQQPIMINTNGANSARNDMVLTPGNGKGLQKFSAQVGAALGNVGVDILKGVGSIGGNVLQAAMEGTLNGDDGRGVVENVLQAAVGGNGGGPPGIGNLLGGALRALF